MAGGIANCSPLRRAAELVDPRVVGMEMPSPSPIAANSLPQGAFESPLPPPMPAGFQPSWGILDGCVALACKWWWVK